jgi:hypothetical protein
MGIRKGSGGDPWDARRATDPIDPRERWQLAAQAVQSMAELGLGLADVRKALVDGLANLPIEESWMGFEGPLADLDRIALQLDALYTELTRLLGMPRPPA